MSRPPARAAKGRCGCLAAASKLPVHLGRMHFTNPLMAASSPISLMAANLAEAEAKAAGAAVGALLPWLLLFAGSLFVSRFLIKKLAPARASSKSLNVISFLGVFVVLAVATSTASLFFLRKQTEEMTTRMAAEKNWGKKAIGDKFSGTLWTRLEGRKVVYRFALDQEPFPAGICKQGFALLDFKGAKYSEQTFFYDDFTKTQAQDGTDVWLVDGVMDHRMNVRTYEAVKDWMIGVLPRKSR